MVTEYGMGTELQSKQVPTEEYSMSDATRRMVDEEQQEIADVAHRRAMHLISENRELLEALALTLLDQEVLEREDIDRLGALHGGEAQRTRRFDRVGDGRERPRVAASERLDPPGARE
jgi:cell division protease FtsH